MARTRFADRGMRVVAGYLEDGRDTLDALLADARSLAEKGLPGGARSALSRLSITQVPPMNASGCRPPTTSVPRSGRSSPRTIAR